MAKGLSNVKEGISQCSSSHNIYEIRSLPRKEPSDFTPQLSKQLQLQQELLEKFRRSKKTRKVSKYLNYILFGAISPFYYGLYWIPKWVLVNKIKPILSAIKQMVSKWILIGKKRADAISNRFALIRSTITAFIDKKTESVRSFFAKAKQLLHGIFKRIAHIIHMIAHPFQTVSSGMRRVSSKIAHFHQKFKEFAAKTLQRLDDYLRSLFAKVSYHRTNTIEIIRSLPRLGLKKLRVKLAAPEKPAEESYVFPVDNTAKEPSAIQKFLQERKKTAHEWIQPRRQRLAESFYRRTAPVRNTVQKILKFKTRKQKELKNKIKSIQEYVSTRYYRATYAFRNLINPLKKRIFPKFENVKSRFKALVRWGENKIKFVSSQKEKATTYVIKKLEPVRQSLLNLLSNKKNKSLQMFRMSLGVLTPFRRMREAIVDRLHLPTAFCCIIPQCGFEILREAFSTLEFLP